MAEKQLPDQINSTRTRRNGNECSGGGGVEEERRVKGKEVEGVREKCWEEVKKERERERG